MTRTAQDAFQNVQKFTVVDNDGFVEAAASFIYRGHLIAFSTMGYSKAIACNAVLVTVAMAMVKSPKNLTVLNPPSSTLIAGLATKTHVN